MMRKLEFIKQIRCQYANLPWQTFTYILFPHLGPLSFIDNGLQFLQMFLQVILHLDKYTYVRNR